MRKLGPYLSVLLVSLAAVAACDHLMAAPPFPSTLEADGTYALESPVDVPPTVLLSGPAAGFVALLQQLHDDPAAALFAALDNAGVPLANDLFTVLPATLKDAVSSAINDDMKERMQGDGGVGGELDQIVAFANSTLTRFTLKSTLTIPAGVAQADAVGTHEVDTLVFDVPGGSAVTVPPELLQKYLVFPGALSASPSMRATGPKGGDGALAVGDHFFGLAYGEAIFAALDGGSTGESLRARLGRVFDCPAMGQYVSQRCVSTVCIGHADEITEICSQGLDHVVTQMHAELATLTFKALRFAAGYAWLWDAPTDTAPRDGLISRIDHGSWKATLDVGTEPQDCKATFTGQRVD